MSCRKRSQVWLHFTPVDNEKGKCDVCKSSFSHRGGSVSNLRKHLQTRHPTLLEEPAAKRSTLSNESSSQPHISQQPSSQSSTTQPSTSQSFISQNLTNQTSTSQTSTSQRRQGTLTTYITRPTPITRQKKLDRALLKMIVKDFQAFSIVEDKGFREFSSLLDPSYPLPSRTTLSKSYLQNIYDDVKQQVKEKLANADSITLTCDGWTSLTNESYMVLTAHYISSDWVLKTYLLDCFPVTESHIAEFLRNEILNVVSSWGIAEKIYCIVTDNAANMKSAANFGTHLQKKKIVMYFHHSSLATSKLNTIHTQLGFDTSNLRMTVKTDGIPHITC